MEPTEIGLEIAEACERGSDATATGQGIVTEPRQAVAETDYQLLVSPVHTGAEPTRRFGVGGMIRNMPTLGIRTQLRGIYPRPRTQSRKGREHNIGNIP